MTIRWAIFPGAFSPFHASHKQIVQETLRQGIVDRVAVVPSSKHYNKYRVMPEYKRFLFARLSLDDVLDSIVLQSDFEFEHWPSLQETSSNAAKHVGINKNQWVWLIGYDKAEWMIKNYTDWFCCKETIIFGENKKAYKGLGETFSTHFNCPARVLNLSLTERSSSIMQDASFMQTMVRLGININS